EIRITDLRIPDANRLGERGQGHRLGQARLGPARLAHCMRGVGQIETALDLMVARATTRYAHGSTLAEKQGIQWLVSESAIELYQAKLMVLHAAFRLEHGLPFATEVSMAKHHVAGTLWRVVDRAVQVHGALGYSKDSPLADMLLQARWSRFADGADEIHKWRVAEAVIDAHRRHGTTRSATGDLPL
ncbi:MAG TPA: acyl-CoA dehydrogenase family protein, partial [Acidimicrobiales bacterium]|nr:acyl-CoA dehydrogenase family protein [Acidimicrobiales bacterium]